jgi:gas vesicle protein
MSFLAGLLMGAIAGGAAALLLTPRAGRELRGSLGHELKRLALKTSAIDLHDWGEVAEEENSRNLVENLERIRAAGL